MADEPVGEVVEAATTSFVAEVPKERLHEPPAFGSLVQVIAGDLGIYGLVAAAQTGSTEPGRRATAFGLPLEELRRQQPQIFELLRTTFTALVLGYREAGRCHLVLPPAPPPVHSFVAACQPAEAVELAEHPAFIRSLLSASGSLGGDELVAACLRGIYACSGEYAFLVRAGRELALELHDDHRRLAGILGRISPYVT